MGAGLVGWMEIFLCKRNADLVKSSTFFQSSSHPLLRFSSLFSSSAPLDFFTF